eukprot:504525-Pelagomonas_calceolata.AAC.1
MVRSAPCNTNTMPQTSTLPIIPAHPARAQHQSTDARKLYQQFAGLAAAHRGCQGPDQLAPGYCYKGYKGLAYSPRTWLIGCK